MPFDPLESYIARLSAIPQAETRVWLDADGRVQGRYFNCTLTSAFQPIRTLDSGRIIGYEAFVRSYSESDHGLCLWCMLDGAASDDESVELDRLCRMLHAINFYRQPEALDADLYLSVHGRLLIAVDGNHGIAFRRILDKLGLPHQKVVLQLPSVTPQQCWLLAYVTDNYRHNGFRLAVNAKNASEALELLERVRPDVIKLDAHRILEDKAALKLLLQDADQLGIRLIFKRLENEASLSVLRQLSEPSNVVGYAQGFLHDLPRASLAPADVVATLIGPQTSASPLHRRGVGV